MMKREKYMQIIKSLISKSTVTTKIDRNLLELIFPHISIEDILDVLNSATGRSNNVEIASPPSTLLDIIPTLSVRKEEEEEKEVFYLEVGKYYMHNDSIESFKQPQLVGVEAFNKPFVSNHILNPLFAEEATLFAIENWPTNLYSLNDVTIVKISLEHAFAFLLMNGKNFTIDIKDPNRHFILSDSIKDVIVDMPMKLECMAIYPYPFTVKLNNAKPPQLGLKDHVCFLAHQIPSKLLQFLTNNGYEFDDNIIERIYTFKGPLFILFI